MLQVLHCTYFNDFGLSQTGYRTPISAAELHRHLMSFFPYWKHIINLYEKNNSLFCIGRGLFIIVWCQRGAATTWFVATGDQTLIFTNAWKALYQKNQRGRPVSWCTKPQKLRPRIKVSRNVLYYVSLEKLFSLGLCFVLLALKKKGFLSCQTCFDIGPRFLQSEGLPGPFNRILGHLSHSGDLLLWVGVRRRASFVNIYSQEPLGQS